MFLQTSLIRFFAEIWDSERGRYALMKTITIHVSDETADALRIFHAGHQAALQGVIEMRSTIADLHPESCVDDHCPALRQIASFDRDIAVGEILQRLHHDLLESLQFAQAEAE